jgi:hypothetical protein
MRLFEVLKESVAVAVTLIILSVMTWILTCFTLPVFSSGNTTTPSFNFLKPGCSLQEDANSVMGTSNSSIIFFIVL